MQNPKALEKQGFSGFFFYETMMDLAIKLHTFTSYGCPS